MLITGLVVVMMMMIESLNIESRGMRLKGLRRTKVGQVVVAALLGSVPGCMGGFATVSLYTHRLFSFGALVAMMIASSGDEAFVMLAMIPEQALVIFAVLFVVAVVMGVIVDQFYDRKHMAHCEKHNHEECGMDDGCETGYMVHECAEEDDHAEHKKDIAKRHFSWKRISMFVGLALFIAALATGNLGHEHHHGEADLHGSEMLQHDGHQHEGHHNNEGHTHERHEGHMHEGHERHEGHVHDVHGHEGLVNHAVESDAAEKAFHIDLLSQDWMNVLFAGLSVIMLFVLLFASDHFVDEHLWNHIVKKHLPVIFAWTFGVLLVLGVALQYIDIEHWISDNTVLMILLATALGIIPESGPHLIFVTLYAAGVIPIPVLLASCISQDGHASIPLLAESKKSFAWAKLINCLVALLVGFGAMLLG